MNIFQLASTRLHWLASRQQAISENIANADTAGFRAKDVQSFDSYLGAVESTPGNSAAPLDVRSADSTTSWAQSLSGNSVVLEEQMVAATDTASKYRMASNLYRKAHEMVIAAAGAR